MIGMVVGTMVAFDAAEYVMFTTVSKTFRKLNPKGAKQTMNVNDFIMAAKAKKAQVGNVATTAAQKVKEAVVSVLPVSNNGMQQAIDARTVDILTVIAMVEQRIDFIQEFVGIAEEAPTMDARMAVDRVQELMAKFTEPKTSAPKQVIPEVVATLETVAVKPRRGFDVAKDWSAVAVNAPQV